ncbi:uncharacterized protein TrAFT101_000727 [Trichoderma asperellum]|uniref:uncharacterized protein n=1 Tax=Trichoderma asperellum TaxID=101201 RepID=UPI00331F64BC|nr:hypothetical protein TrAFT101_000727 [Trichoderma asperellum]
MPVRQWIRRLKGTPRPSGQLEGIEHGGNNQADASTLSNAIPASSTSVDASPAPISSFIAVSNARPELEPALVIVDRSSRSPEHLWDLAYDELKVNDAALVDAYEKILSCHLCDRDPESDGDVDEENIIAQGDPGARRAQMEQLVTSGLVKIKREAKMKESLDKGMQVVMSAKEVIRSAIQTIPQAALAWTGVCVALELFCNLTSATKANRDGIEYVVRRMGWYWELPETILTENTNAYSHLSNMKGGLEVQLIGLYKILLLYQMKSVCSYYKSRGFVFLRDLAKLDDWDGDIIAIEKAETIFYKDSDVHRKEKMNANLEQLAKYVEKKMTKEDLQCFKDMGITDPSYDKKRIEKTKGGLLEQSYRWILDNPDFQLWRDDTERRLLWIRGDPGKGKTMLLCGIANELRKPSPSSGLVSYFFCQATDRRINNANAVVWGLMFMLVGQQPALMHHIRSRFDASGKELFTGVNSWFALSEIFSDMLRDPALTYAYLLIDALDECISDREKLLDLVVESLSTSSRVKWLVSSRNWPEIERRLAGSGGLERISLSLEVNADLVSRAVDAYIEHEISQLNLIKQYPMLKNEIQHQMQQKANGTFLWVALVVKDLHDRQDAEYVNPSHILDVLLEMPSNLTALYSRMVDHIVKLKGDSPELCQKILSVAALTFRPLSLVELRILARFDRDRIDDRMLERLVNKCGSFLTIRDGTVYFVHQSAKDHLVGKSTKSIIFPSGLHEVHSTVFLHSLEAMTLVLQKNIYHLPHPGSHIDEIETPDPDPLAAIRYSCAHWIDHFCDGISHNDRAICQNYLNDDGPVSVFLHTHFLHWLEALSLLRKISDNVISIARLEKLLKTQSSQTQLIRFLHDGYRFVLYFLRAIEMAPLQIYSSALIFSPIQSLVRQLFHNDLPSWIHNRPIMNYTWSPCLQTLEGHGSEVNCVVLLGDSKLATGSNDETIKIWDIATGTCLQTLARDSSLSLLSLKNEKLASGSRDATVRIWDIVTGVCVQTLQGHSRPVTSIIALTENKLASGSLDNTVRIWDMAAGICIRILKGHRFPVKSITALTDDKLASGSNDQTTKIWDIDTGVCVQTLEGHGDWVESITALADNKLASGSNDGTIKVWDIVTGVCVQTLKGHCQSVKSITALTDDKLASGSSDGTIKIWDMVTGVCMQTLEGHGDWVTSITVLIDNKMASGSIDGTIKIWDIVTGIYGQTLDDHKDWVYPVALSKNGSEAVPRSDDATVNVWDIAPTVYIQTLKGHSNWVYSVALSADGRQVASGSRDEKVKIWDVATGTCVQTLEGHSNRVKSVAFSINGRQVASGSCDSTVKIWDIATGACVQTLKGHEDWVRSVTFSGDGRQIASGAEDRTVKIWDTATGVCVQTLEGHRDWVNSVALSADGRRVASGSRDEKVKIWDTVTGICLQTLPVGVVTQLFFDEEKESRLHTNLGILDLDSGPVVNGPVSEVSVDSVGYGIHEDGVWITRDSKPLLWLPWEYRPTASVVVGSTVVIGSIFGRVLMFQFSEEG